MKQRAPPASSTTPIAIRSEEKSRSRNRSRYDARAACLSLLLARYSQAAYCMRECDSESDRLAEALRHREAPRGTEAGCE
jgi:hypothetical protein